MLFSLSSLILLVAGQCAGQGASSTHAFPSDVKHAAVVQPLFEKISTSWMKCFLKRFTAFNNRYLNSDSGVAASEWLQAQITTTKLHVETFNHTFRQKSIIARIPGAEHKDQIVIVGAHMDSINYDDPMHGRAPGADDNGTGTTAILQALHVLVASGFRPKRTVEFHWYAGEEGTRQGSGGMLGSHDVAKKYADDKKNVVGMVNFDMAGHPSRDRTVALVTDATNPALNTFLDKLTRAYLGKATTTFTCGYKCSDYASWSNNNFPASFPIEDDLNSRIHSSKDTLEFVDYNYVKEFTKLALAFVVEAAEPSP